MGFSLFAWSGKPVPSEKWGEFLAHHADDQGNWETINAAKAQAEVLGDVYNDYAIISVSSTTLILHNTGQYLDGAVGWIEQDYTEPAGDSE